MIQKVVNWGMTTANEIRVESVNSPQIDWKGSVMQEIRSESFTCEMVFDNVSFTSLPLCLGNLSGVFIQNGYGQDGIVSVTLDEFAAQACSVPIKCKGCSLTCASIIIAEKSQSGRAHVVCGNGTGHVELGTTAIPIECLITPVSQAWRLVSHAVGRYTSNGLAGVGGVWEDLSGNLKFSWGGFLEVGSSRLWLCCCRSSCLENLPPWWLLFWFSLFMYSLLQGTLDVELTPPVAPFPAVVALSSGSTSVVGLIGTTLWSSMIMASRICTLRTCLTEPTSLVWCVRMRFNVRL